MRIDRLRSALAAIAALLPLPALAQNATTFTYQGKLTDTGGPANSTYDVRVTPYGNATGGTALATTVCADNVVVVDGVFSILLPSSFAQGGGDLFLEFQVRPDPAGTAVCSNAAGFTTLSPRQPVTPAPTAAFAQAVSARPLERAGAIRFNATAGRFEGFTGAFWVPFLVGDPITPANSATFSTPGAQTFVVPAGVTSLVADVWGAGGGGGPMNTGGVTASSCPLPSFFRGGGGGGGSGAYGRFGIPVTPGETLTIIVGSGGGPGSFNNPGQPGGSSQIRRGVTHLVNASGGGGGFVGNIHSPSQGGAASGLGGSGGGAPTAAAGITVSASQAGLVGFPGFAPDCIPTSRLLSSSPACRAWVAALGRPGPLSPRCPRARGATAGMT